MRESERERERDRERERERERNLCQQNIKSLGAELTKECSKFLHVTELENNSKTITKSSLIQLLDSLLGTDNEIAGGY